MMALFITLAAKVKALRLALLRKLAREYPQDIDRKWDSELSARLDVITFLLDSEEVEVIEG
jgi:hypothetical protein